MKETQQIQISEYNYPLPDERIAKYPLSERDASKLLIYQQGNISESIFSDLPQYLSAGELIVFNNTKVIQARLHFQKSTGAAIEIFCLEPIAPHDYVQNFQQTGAVEWLCLIGNAKKWKEGTLHKRIKVAGEEVLLCAERVETRESSHRVRFSWDGSLTFAEILQAIGELPIPPYLNRETEAEDEVRYQTVYSKIKGSVAAPTAGLHFTESVLQRLLNAGVEKAEVTLHVGAGTFKPVKATQIKDHEMHVEYIVVKRETIVQLLQHLGRIVAVGTTSVRTLESLYHIGAGILRGEKADSEGTFYVRQWSVYENTSITAQEALTAILSYVDHEGITELRAGTQIIIAPGYVYRVVNKILTNFHQPQSTLLLLVSAFVGEDWKRIYDYALGHDFRFLSYGDSSLLMP